MKQNLIYESEHFTISQANDFRIPGYLIVGSKEAGTSLAGFTHDQSADLMSCLIMAEDLVQEIIKPERIYVLKFGEEVPQIHFHIFPRTVRLLNAYLDHVTDQAPYSGARIMDWTWNHHESVDFTEADVQAFVIEARARLIPKKGGFRP